MTNNYVAVDAASKHLTVLAVKDGKTSLRHIPDCSLRHSVRIMSEVEAAMDELALTPAECDFFAAVVGPGSFTGIRIGISTAKGLAVGAGKPLLSITAFDLIAYSVSCSQFVAVVDAAHGHYYACVYQDGKAQTPCYLSQEEVEALALPVFGFEELTLNAYQKIDVTQGLTKAVQAKRTDVGGEMNALYVRKSQAEEGRA